MSTNLATLRTTTGVDPAWVALADRAKSLLAESLMVYAHPDTGLDGKIPESSFTDDELRQLDSSIEWAENRLSRTPTREDLQRIARDFLLAAHNLVRGNPFYLRATKSRTEDLVRNGPEYQLLNLGRRVADLEAELATEAIADAAARVEGLENDAERARDAARKASGETGAQTLAGYWKSYAGEQARRALGWRIASGVVVGATVGLGIYLGVPDTTAEAVQHSASSIVGLALAGYLATEGSRHRKAAQWAGALEVQLKSLAAYCEMLTPEDASKLRASFAGRVFGEPPSSGDGGEITPLAQIASFSDSVLHKKDSSADT